MKTVRHKPENPLYKADWLVADCLFRKARKLIGEHVVDGPPYFEDDEPCGYCQRPPGGKHEVWCRQ